MKISEILKNKSTISFEVFPPKNKEGDISSIYSTIEGLDVYKRQQQERSLIMGWKIR